MDTQKDLVAEFVIYFTDNATSTFDLNENTFFRNKLSNICINFRNYNYARASKTLFKLFYGDKFERDTILSELFQTSKFSIMEESTTLEKNVPNFSEDEIRVFTQELLYQYSRCNPDFLAVDEYEEYKKELDELKLAMTNEPLLFYRAVQQCELICHIDHIVNNSLIFLNARIKSWHMKGLEIIGHNFQHRVLLLPYAKKIGILLKAMHDAKNSSLNRISPFMTWLSQHEKDDFVNTSSIELPKVLLFNELTKSSDLIRILPNSSILVNCISEVTSNVMSSAEYENLVKAIISFFYAKQSCLEAENAFSLGDYESLANFSKTRRNFEKVNILYNNALDSFLSFCES